MRKGVIIGLIVVTALILVSTVYAHFPGSNFRTGCKQVLNTDTDAITKFQRDTLSLRDELFTKRLEVRKEYQKNKPDRERIAELKKEIIDIETKIQKKADEAGLPVCRKGIMGYGMINKDVYGPRCQRMKGL